MSSGLPPILIVDDEKNMRGSLLAVLEGEDFDVVAEESAEEGLQRLEKEDFFMVITDCRLGGMSGYQFLEEIKKRWPDMPVLMLTAYATPKLAVEAIKAGAIDYLAKPFAPEELLLAVDRCAERHSLIRENADLKASREEDFSLERIIGDHEDIRRLRDLIGTVAPTDATVLILGESGTGKELVAGATHQLSRRKNGRYVRINCAAIPDTLLESELFGHEKGAFTGALKQKAGRVEEADGGTIFLDEIGDMSRPLQAKLLRFLEDGSFTRVGGNEERRVNVRLIAATNRDVIEAIKENEFREDLFHRLNVMQFRPPPLRDRGEDILLLAEHFLVMFSTSIGKPMDGFSDDAKAKMLAYHWPGNVRELRNAIERAVIIEPSRTIKDFSLPDFKLETGLRREGMEDAANEPVPVNQPLDQSVGDFEKKIILASLNANQGNLNKTAKLLGLSRHALRYRMQRLEIGSDDKDDDLVNDKSAA